eukprot:5589817-Prymnesium_polylepis.1
METQRASPDGETRSIHRPEPRVTLTIQVLIQFGTIFEAGSDFAQIGCCVSEVISQLAGCDAVAPSRCHANENDSDGLARSPRRDGGSIAP